MLPVYRTRLIDRDAEIASIQRLIRQPDVGLLTLTGPGGSGKTRLAAAIGALQRDQFPDGVFFLPLATVNDPDLVAAVLAQELTIRDEGSRSVSRSIVNFLQNKRVLLILDNFEQIVSAVPVVSELLAWCPQLKILVTSRTPLHLYGEYEFPVHPLRTEGLGAGWQGPGAGDQESGVGGHRTDPTDRPHSHTPTLPPAIELFVERARAVKPDFVLTPENTPIVARICAQVDGLPLAIELAAARIKVLDPAAMLARLEHPLALLNQGPADVARRHQSLRSAIQWSYELLEDDERRTFRHLAVFERDFTLEQAEAVAAPATFLTFDRLASLVDKSLLRVSAIDNDDQSRYHMLKTIREYALERLGEAGEIEDARRGHARSALALAEEAGTRLTHGGWLQRLEDAHDDIRAAIIWSCADEPGSETALRLTAAIWRFWMFRGYAKELRSWIEAALENSASLGADPAFAVVRARALAGAGVLAYHEDDFDATGRELETSAAIFQEHDDRWGLAFCKMYLGFLAARRNDTNDLVLLTEAVSLFRETGDHWGLAQALNPLGTAFLRRGDFPAAGQALDECRQLFRELDDRWGMALACRSIGRIHYRKGEYEEAAGLLTESIELLREVGDRTTMSGVFNLLGEVRQAQHDDERATKAFTESLTLSREVGIPDNVALVLGNLGAQAYRHGELEQAKTHFQESLLLNQKLGRDEGAAAAHLCLAALAIANRNSGEAHVHEERARALLERFRGALAYAEHLRSGYAFQAVRTVYELVQAPRWIGSVLSLPSSALRGYAELAGRPELRAKPELTKAGLTSREIDVLRLVAQGNTNQEISRKLVISMHTVTRHLTHIYTKTGLSNRAEAVAYAIYNDLTADSSMP